MGTDSRRSVDGTPGVCRFGLSHEVEDTKVELVVVPTR